MWNNTLKQIARQMVRSCSDAPRQLRREKCVNTVTLIGRVGNDPELKNRDLQLEPYASFSLATNLYFKRKSGEDFEQKTEWHKINVYRPQLRDLVTEIVRKGDRLYVQGRISSVFYQRNNVQLKATRITAEEVVRLASSGNKTQISSDTSDSDEEWDSEENQKNSDENQKDPDENRKDRE